MQDVEVRLMAYRERPGDLEHAKDCGLFAMQIPVRFGGLFTRDWKHANFIRTVSRRMAFCIDGHEAVCHDIIWLGTPVQYDLFLPQLASGKQLGITAKGRNSIRVENAEDGYYLSGTFDTSTVENGLATLVCIEIDSYYRAPHFVVPITLLMQGNCLRHGRNTLYLHNAWVPNESELGYLDASQSGIEKWEAIRWRTDQSVNRR